MDRLALPNLKLHFLLKRDRFCMRINTEIIAQGVTAVLGPSGSGKSTLLRYIAGLEPAAVGNCQFDDQVWQHKGHFTLTHQRNIGFVFQDTQLFSHLNVLENLNYAYKRARTKHINLSQVIPALGIEHILHRYPHKLSGGQQQRVAIARALASNPQLLLMDEPLSSLDVNSKLDIIPYLENLYKVFKIPIIYVTHAIEEVARLADNVIILEQGQIIAQDQTNAILTNENLPTAFLDEACAVLHGNIIKHERDYHLSHISLSTNKNDKAGKANRLNIENSVAISFIDAPEGHPVKVRIYARDVSLSPKPAKDSTINNCLLTTISKISSTQDPAKVLVSLSLEGNTVLAQITEKSRHLLNLQEGQTIYAYIKSVALMSS